MFKYILSSIIFSMIFYKIVELELYHPIIKSKFFGYFQYKKTSYVAAVVEYQPHGNPWEYSASELINLNLEQYKRFISNASLFNADIIVFPEYGLTTLGIPRDRNAAKQFLLQVPNIGDNPCVMQSGSEVIQELSCAAKIYNIYLVVNLGEIRDCQNSSTSCPTDGVFQFNTNVAFDREGFIVAKYEKANLYFEDQFDKPDVTTLSTFTTDFNITFGMFTCFDIIFSDPAVRLVDDMGIRNFVFPTAWVDELPFLMAIQAQSMWAYTANANLLAAGYHQPLGGQLGSGIYAGRKGHLRYTFNSDSGSKMILAQVPMDPSTTNSISSKQYKKSKSNIAAYHSFLREDLQNYTTKILLTEKLNGSERICTENNFCCQVDYEMTNEENEIIKRNFKPTEEDEFNYRLVAFNGNRTVAAKTAEYHWQVCGIIRCLNNTLASCTENSKENNNRSNFKTLQISAEFDIRQREKEEDNNYYSFGVGFNALDTQFDLISRDKFLILVSNNTVNVSSSEINTTAIQTLAMINKIFYS